MQLTDRPNVILIMADQWRGDCLGAAGHPDVMTPYLDTLCQQGIRFPNACTATPTCIPARAAILTGMAQENHRRVGYLDGVRWDYSHTLAGEFTKAGYQTHCSGKMHVHPLRNRMGFQDVELHDGYLHYYRKPEIPYYENQRVADDYHHWLKNELGIEADPTETGIDCNSFVARPWVYEEKYHPTRWVTDRAIDFLRRRDRDVPFFLTVSYVRPHPPFDAPQHFFDMYRNKELTPPIKGDWDDLEGLSEKGMIFDSYTGPQDPKLQREAQIGYYASITQVDYEFGRLREAMFSHGLNRDNTVVMFISDHGEMLCDHALFRKSLPYRGSATVPFVIDASRELMERAAGGKIPRDIQNRVVELRDVMPTLLNLCGIEIPESIDGENVFSPDFDREYIHGEHLFGKGSCQWIITETDKFIWFSDTGKRQYFDLINDLQERHNAINDEKYKKRICRLQDILIRELTWREEGFVENGKLITGRLCKEVLSKSRDL